MFLVLLGCLVCLAPLTMYFLVLATINHRRRPTLVPGAWDFVGVLLASSGFLLFGGSALLTSLEANWRAAWYRADFDALRHMPQDDRRFWYWALGGYFGLVAGGSAFLIYQRRRATVLYNVDPDMLEDRLPLVLDDLGVAWSRSGRRYTLGTPEKGTPEALVEVQPFGLMGHVTLRWYAEQGALRQTFETALARVLPELAPDNNPSAGWFMTAAAGLFVFMLMSLGLLVYLFVLIRRSH